MNSETNDRILTATRAYEMASQGKVILVDVRTVDEWKQTGIGEKAHAICMSDTDFLGKIQKLTENNKDQPIAVICAAGGRSARVVQALLSQGYNFVYDVSEGMVGGPYGAGWINQNLPLTAVA